MFSRISKRQFSRVSYVCSSVFQLWFGLVCTEDNGSFTSVISTLHWVRSEWRMNGVPSVTGYTAERNARLFSSKALKCRGNSEISLTSNIVKTLLDIILTKYKQKHIFLLVY